MSRLQSTWAALVAVALSAVIGTGCAPTGDSEAPEEAAEEAEAEIKPEPCDVDADCKAAGPCRVATCHQNMCKYKKKHKGEACDDGDACTQNDTCQAGVCVGASPVVCAAAVGPCQLQPACNPATGQCTALPAQAGTACDDGDACTQNDTCQSGVCVGENPVACPPADQCHLPGTCDPSTGACSPPVAKEDGAACDDGDACTQDDTCQAGACTGANPVVCPPPDQCHLPGTCDPSTGACDNPLANEGIPCDDGDACSATDRCVSGVCAGMDYVSCPAPEDVCHVQGTCDPGTGLCDTPLAPDGTSCDDGNLCTQTDACQAGACAGSPVVCPVPNECHSSTCDLATGLCSTPIKVNGKPCDDGNTCTEADHCQGGTCKGSNKPNGAACSDGDGCTVSDQCKAGACKGNPVVCPGGACDPSTGTCGGNVAAELPESVTFTLLFAACSEAALDLYVNGTLVETVAPAPSCGCDRAPEVITITDPGVLSLIDGCDDTFSVGLDRLHDDIALGFVKVDLSYEDEPLSICLLDALLDGACAPRDLCDAYEMGGAAPSTTSLRRASCAGEEP